VEGFKEACEPPSRGSAFSPSRAARPTAWPSLRAMSALLQAHPPHRRGSSESTTTRSWAPWPRPSGPGACTKSASSPARGAARSSSCSSAPRRSPAAVSQPLPHGHDRRRAPGRAFAGQERARPGVGGRRPCILTRTSAIGLAERVKKKAAIGVRRGFPDPAVEKSTDRLAGPLAARGVSQPGNRGSSETGHNCESGVWVD